MGRLSPEDLKQLGLPGLLPLMVLTKGGATRQTTEDVITGLQAAGKQESLPITYTLASLVFKNEADQEWLRKRVRQMQDILRDTPIYQEILKEGREEARREAEEAREEARRKALEEGREEGKLEALRIMLLDFIKARFPTRKMINLAKSQAAMIEDLDVLQSLILKVGLAQTAEEAQEYLISWPETYDGHE